MELEDRNLWEIVATDDDATFATFTPERKRKAFRIIARTISEDIQHDILDFDCPRALWRKLASRFQPMTRLRRLQASKSLYAAKMSPNEDMESYVNRVMGYASEIEKAGSAKIDEEQVCNVLVNGLPDDYETLVSMVCTFKDEDYTPEKLESLLCGEYKRKTMKQQESIPVEPDALLARKKYYSRDHDDSRKCYVCKKIGHFARNCRFRGDPRYDTNGKIKDENSMSAICLNVASLSRDNQWLIDSGASSHFSPFREDFIEYKPLKEQRSVSLASNVSCKIVGIGIVPITSKTRNGEFRIKLHDVYHVPAFNFRLLSIAKMEMKGYKIVIKKGVCRVFNDKDLVIEATRGDSNLYALPTDELSAQRCSGSKCLNVGNWHERLGHVNVDTIKLMQNKNLVIGLEGRESKETGETVMCESCIKGKGTRKSFPKTGNLQSNHLLDLVHTDVCGPMPIESNGKYLYFVTFIDDFSRRATIYFLRRKDEVLECFKKFKAMAEKQTGNPIKKLRSDNGREYVNKAFEEFLESHGILRQLSAPYSPQQNGIAERFNRTILDLTRTMMVAANTPKTFWAEAVNTACYIRNRCPTLSDKLIPEELWSGRKISVRHLRPFGCKVFIHVPKEKRRKLDDRSITGVLLGYSSATKGYRVWDTENKRVLVSRDVLFEEGIFPFKGTSYLVDHSALNYTKDTEQPQSERNREAESEEFVSIEVIQNKHPDRETEELDRNINRSKILNEPLEEVQEQEDQEVQDNETDLLREIENCAGREEAQPHVIEGRTLRDRMKIKKPEYYCAITSADQINEPKTYSEAMKSPDHELWRAAMEEELTSLYTMKVWELTDLPLGKKAIGCRWVFKVKRLADGSVERYKARLVAQGFTQIPGIDYEETYSPVVSLPAVRLILKLAVNNGWKIHQMDVKTAYLHGELKEEIYMVQPEGTTCPGSKDKVCRLLKSLYGLKQSGRSWYETLDKKLLREGMKKCKAEPCIYYRQTERTIIILLVYVDDLILISSNQEGIEYTKTMLKRNFEMKDLGELNYILGIQIKKQPDGSITLNQSKYILEILEEFGMDQCRPVSTPLDPKQPLSKADSPTTEEEKKAMKDLPYRRLIGKLMYLAQATRPDLAFVVSKLGQFAANPGKAHWAAGKRVLRYLRGTVQKELVIRKGRDEIVGLSDSDWAGSTDDRRSTTGFLIQLGETPIIWKSSKQNSVALSTMEAEFVALASCCIEMSWLTYILSELNYATVGDPVIKCDNQSAISFVKGNSVSSHTRHVDIKLHFVHDLVKFQKLKIEYVPTHENVADLLTKALPGLKNQNFRDALLNGEERKREEGRIC